MNSTARPLGHRGRRQVVPKAGRTDHGRFVDRRPFDTTRLDVDGSRGQDAVEIDIDVWDFYGLTAVRSDVQTLATPRQPDADDGDTRSAAAGPTHCSSTPKRQLVRLLLATGSLATLGLGAWIGAAISRPGSPESTVRGICSSGLERQVSIGTSGSDALCVESRLDVLGYDAGPVDGTFDEQTDTAVRSFQRDHGHTVDGVVGPRTAASLGLAFHNPA